MSKEVKQIIQNPFSLYYSFDVDTEADRKKNKKATKEFKKCWETFVEDWQKLQKKHEELGASDTAAREVQADWIAKHSNDIF